MKSTSKTKKSGNGKIANPKNLQKAALQLTAFLGAVGALSASAQSSDSAPLTTSGSSSAQSTLNKTAPKTTGAAANGDLVNDDATALPEITVVAQNETTPSYGAENVSLSQYTAPLLDTPQSVTVVNRQLLDDQAANTLRDALKNVPSVTISAGEGGQQGDKMTLRGFDASQSLYLDGMLDTGSYYRDPFDLQAVEVFEGPDSVNFGRGTTGGVINQVTKTPLADPMIAGTIALGTDLTRRATLDINEPVKGGVFGIPTAFRLNLMGTEADVSGLNVTNDQRFGIAPSLELGIGTPTRLTISYLHETDNDVPTYGIPWYFNGPSPVNYENFYGFTNDYLKTDVDMITAKIEHDFNENLSVHDQFRFANYDRDWRITEPKIEGVPGDPGVIGSSYSTTNFTPRTPFSSLVVARNQLGGTSTETNLDNQLEGKAKFDTGFIKHTLVAGAEFLRQTSDPTRYSFTGVPNASLFDPDEKATFSGTQSVKSMTSATVTDVGIYALDTISITKYLDISGGFRWDYVQSSFEQSYPTVLNFDRTDSMPTWRAAIVFKPVKNGSIYFDCGTSFDPSAESLSLSTATADLSPEKSATFEVGAKWSFFSDKLLLNGSIFRTDMTNVREPSATDSSIDVLSGEQRVNGLELGVSGHLTKDWQVMAGYAYLDSEVVKSAAYPASVGSPLANVPKNSMSFWTTYQIPSWHLEVGVGVNYIGSRTASSTAPLAANGLVKEVPDYWTLNAMVKYHVTKNIDVQCNINNLTNNDYIEQEHPGHLIPGAGINALFTTSFKF